MNPEFSLLSSKTTKDRSKLLARPPHLSFEHFDHSHRTILPCDELLVAPGLRRVFG
jgi:hypothetical protein